LAFDLNSRDKEESELWELERMKKGVNSSISPWPCLHPIPPKNMNKIRQAVWNCHGAKNEQRIIPALMQDFGSF
jgi:hypothetical protein